MGSIDHKTSRSLVDRYLTVGARFSERDDSAMRGHLRECTECRTHYDRKVVAHRLMTGGSAEIPSGLERQRMMSVILAGAAPEKAPFWSSAAARAWFAGLALAGAATAAVLLVDRNMAVPLPSPGEYIGARGGGHADVTVGIGLSGVTEDGREYEAVEGNGLFLDDYLRITTSREVDDHGFVAVIGFQDGRAPIWYTPNPEEGETMSQAVERDRSVPLGGRADPIEFKVSGRHVPGRLVVAAVFTDSPLPVAALTAMFGQGAPITASDAPEALEETLEGLAEGAVVRLKVLDVVAGSKRDAPQ